MKVVQVELVDFTSVVRWRFIGLLQSRHCYLHQKPYGTSKVKPFIYLALVLYALASFIDCYTCKLTSIKTMQ